MSVVLRINEAEIKDNKLIINELSIYDKKTNEKYRVAKINEEILELIKAIEIDIELWLNYKTLKRKNENIDLLIKTFKLWIE